MEHETLIDGTIEGMFATMFIMTGLLQNITVPGGRLVSFLYGSGTPTSLLSTVQDWSGRLWTLLYDSNRNLTTMITPLGCSTQYTYSLAGTTSTLTSTP